MGKGNEKNEKEVEERYGQVFEGVHFGEREREALALAMEYYLTSCWKIWLCFSASLDST